MPVDSSIGRPVFFTHVQWAPASQYGTSEHTGISQEDVHNIFHLTAILWILRVPGSF